MPTQAVSAAGDGIARGAYGFRITGLAEADRLLSEVPSDWPELAVIQSGHRSGVAARPAGTVELDEDGAVLWLAEPGQIELTRDPLTVCFCTDAPLTPEAIVHPFLGLPAALAARWQGRPSLHGGAFVHAGRAWGLLGDREAGKSLMLAALLETGHPVLSDDILIVEDATVFSGPRTIDLRAAGASSFGGTPLGTVGNRERWRVWPPPAPPVIELGGFVVLEWGSSTRLEPLGADARLRQLIGSSALRPDSTAARPLLELAQLPAWRFTRAPEIAAVTECVERMLDALAPA